MLLDDEICPVSLEMLGVLYRLPETDLFEPLAKFTPQTRARLALYCAQRSHLRAMGLAIASTCEYSDLYALGGKAGAALFEDSRSEPVQQMESQQSRARRKITLASRAA